MRLRPGRPVVVAGGINADLLARSLGPLTPGTSNPATLQLTPGGVARNVAENLARLGTPVRLLGAVGQDALGDSVLEASARAGVDVSLVLRRPGVTGSYLAVLDPAGELHLGLAAMGLTEGLDLPLPSDWLKAVHGAGLLVLDANLPLPVLLALLDAARGAGVPTLLEPVSAPKAARWQPEALRGGLRGTFLITPDRAELAALSGLPAGSEGEVARAAAVLHDWGVEKVLLTLGADGCLLLRPSSPPLHFPAYRVAVQDVTGAGDALLAGVVAALSRGYTLEEAARLGQACAALTVQSPFTVRPDLSWDALHAVIGEP
ncbi:MAG: carbohydrate kinase family protein [Deinococcus sp.]